MSQPPPPATSEALVTVTVTVAATAPVGQPERQSSDLDLDYDQANLYRAPLHLTLLHLPHLWTLKFWCLTLKGEKVRVCEIGGELVRGF